MENTDKQMILRDFSVAEPQSAWSTNRQPGKWQLKSYRLASGDTGRALWVEERIKLGEGPYPLPGEVTVDPKLCGWHAVYVLVDRPKWFGGIDVRLSDRPWTFINPMEREVYRPDPRKRAEITGGKNDIEIEVFYLLARMDGQKIHLRYPNGKQMVEFPAERGRANITGLRFRPVDDAEVREYFEDQKNPDHKRIIINFETFGMIPVLEQRIAAWAVSDVWAIHMEIAVVGGGVLYPGSQHEQMWGENISKSALPALKPWIRDGLLPWRELQSKGKTPFDIAVPAARAAGILVIGALRMDLFWGDGSENPADWKPGTCDDYPSMFNGRFYPEHPNLRIPGGHNQLDYYYPEVRNHFADLLCEAAERLDLDGINMDFTRWPPFIRSDADLGIMVEFIRDVRRRLDDVGRRKGRKLSLSADVVDGYYCGLTLTQQRIDLEAWLKTGCLDYVSIERTNEPYRPATGDHPIEYYIDLGRRMGTPVYPRQDQVIEGMDPPCAIYGCSELDSDPLIGDELLDDPKAQPYCGPEHYEKRTLQYYQMGAQRVMLSNRWDGWLSLRRLGHRKELEERTKTGKVFGVREGDPIEFEK
jgi:hypothetical protein